MGAGGGEGGGEGGERCVFWEMCKYLVSDKMGVPRLGPFTDQNGRFLDVYFELL